MKKVFTIDNILSFICTLSLLAWILAPIMVMYRNFKTQGISPFAAYKSMLTTYYGWLGFMMIAGAVGLLAGLIYLIRRAILSKMSGKEKMAALAPIWAMLAFIIWCTINTFCFAEDQKLAISGQLVQMDCLLVYLCYGGMILAGLTVARNKHLTMIVIWAFLAISTFMAMMCILDNDAAYSLFVNSLTNTFHYEAVFYNTNHYGYYLTLIIVVSAYLLSYRSDWVEKMFYGFVYVINLWTLILNNTMGAYLAVLLTFIFAVIWSFINKEEKKWPLIILGIFVAISIVSTFMSDSIVTNFADMFSDISTVIEMDDSELEGIGSNRGERWMKTIERIKEKPLVGHGLQSITEYTTHNIYLQQAAYTGIPGLLLFLSIFVVGATKLVKARKTITPLARGAAFAVVAYLISAFFGNTIFYTATYFYIILGFCLTGAMDGLLVETKKEDVS